MFGKLLVIVLAVGATACTLLVNRQQRIDTAHEIAVVHQRLLSQEQSLWTLRRDVADRVRPEIIRLDVQTLGGAWAAIPARPPTDAFASVIRITLLPLDPVETEHVVRRLVRGPEDEFGG